MNLKRIGQATALDKKKWIDFLVNGGIFMAAALVTYVSENVGKLDLGEWSPLIAAGVALGLKYLSKFIESLKTKEADPKPAPNDPNFPVN